MPPVLWTQRHDFGPSPRVRSAMAYDSMRRSVVLFGGDPVRAALIGDTWQWDGADWTQLADTGPSPRAGAPRRI